jgi:hypothetical protein
MYTLYTACASSTNKAVMGEWESINNYETLQFEKNKKRYPEYFGCSNTKNSAIEFDHSLIRENDKRRLRLSRQEVEELLDLENGMQENYLINNHSKKFEDLKYFKPISPLIHKKIIQDKMKTDENRINGSIADEVTAFHHQSQQGRLSVIGRKIKDRNKVTRT